MDNLLGKDFFGDGFYEIGVYNETLLFSSCKVGKGKPFNFSMGLEQALELSNWLATAIEEIRNNRDKRLVLNDKLEQAAEKLRARVFKGIEQSLANEEIENAHQTTTED